MLTVIFMRALLRILGGMKNNLASIEKWMNALAY